LRNTSLPPSLDKLLLEDGIKTEGIFEIDTQRRMRVKARLTFQKLMGSFLGLEEAYIV
jgi:hypothetical protein